MAFVPEKAKEAQAKQFEGEWKVFRRSGCDVLMTHPAHPDFLREMRRLEAIERKNCGLHGRKADLPLPDEAREEIMARAISRKLMKDWRRVEHENGEPIAFSEAIAYSLLKDVVNFRMDALDHISAMGEDESAELEAISGNS